MSKNDVNLNAIKNAENRYTQATTSLRKPVQVNAQSTTLLIESVAQTKKLLGNSKPDVA
jgi:hypothetical protein